MRTKELDNLVRTGTLKSEPPDRKEFEGLVESGRRRLVDARKLELSSESRFDLAYGAAHALSLAALRRLGYRPDRRRYVVFQALPHTLGLGPEIWRVLDKCHGVRNAAEYEGYFEVDQRLLTDLISATDAVLSALEQVGLPPPKR